MKKCVLMISKTFPASHYKAGQPTCFADKIKRAHLGIRDVSRKLIFDQMYKYHTIRANCDYWEECFRYIDAGDAYLSIREWAGIPYRSKQIELMRLTKNDGIGLQKLTFEKDFFITDRLCRPFIDGLRQDVSLLANNDGLHLSDWLFWFEKYDLDKPMAVIQFTNFRYN